LPLLALILGYQPLAEFPSRRLLNGYTAGDASALAMNYSRRGTAKRCVVLGMKLREFFFTKIWGVFLHNLLGPVAFQNGPR
jgi:hypothetical protein